MKNSIERIKNPIERMKTFVSDQIFEFGLSQRAQKECQKRLDNSATKVVETKLEVAAKIQRNKAYCHLDAESVRDSERLTEIIAEKGASAVRICAKAHTELYNEMSKSEELSECTTKWLAAYYQLLDGCVTNHVALSKEILENRKTHLQEEEKTIDI